MAATPIVKVIYGKPMLPDLARVLACLYEKKIMFELEDMNRGVRMPQDILNLQISSHGHTPMLIDGPDELFGSRKICRHVVEKYGVNGYQNLLGKDPLARVSVEQWIQSEEHSYDPPSSALLFYLPFKIQEADAEKKSKSEKKMEKVLNLYEQRLGESEFLAGNYFTLADLHHLPNTYYLQSSAEYGHLFKDRQNVSRWWKNISERDSWKMVVNKFEEEDLQLMSNRKTESSVPGASKPVIKDKKETSKSDEDDTSLTGITAERKEADANKPASEVKKEEPKPADKDKSISDITAERKEADANKTDITSERKESDANKKGAEGEEVPPKPADGKDGEDKTLPPD